LGKGLSWISAIPSESLASVAVAAYAMPAGAPPKIAAIAYDNFEYEFISIPSLF
jgi:hypothetical protein